MNREKTNPTPHTVGIWRRLSRLPVAAAVCLLAAGCGNGGHNRPAAPPPAPCGFKTTPITFYDAGHNPVELAFPFNVQCVAQRWYVRCREGVLEFDSQRRFQKVLFPVGQGPGEISQFTTVMLTVGSELWILDRMNNRLMIHDPARRNTEILSDHPYMYIASMIQTGDGVWFGGKNALFRRAGKKAVMERFPLETGIEGYSSFYLLAGSGGALVAVGESICGHDALAVFNQQNGGRFTFTRVPFTANDDCRQFIKTDKQRFFAGLTVISGALRLSLFLQNQDHGDLFFCVRGSGAVELFYQKEWAGTLFSVSGRRRFITECNTGGVFELETGDTAFPGASY